MFVKGVHIWTIMHKIFVVVAESDEYRGRIYGKIALWRYVSWSRIWTTICNIIMTHETKTSYWPVTHWLFHFKAWISLAREKCFMASAIIVDKGFPFMEGYRFSPVFPKHTDLMAQLYNWLCNVTAFVYHNSTVFFLPINSGFQEWIVALYIARSLRLIAYWGPIFGYANIARKCNFWKGTLTVCPASLFFSSRNHH